MNSTLFLKILLAIFLCTVEGKQGTDSDLSLLTEDTITDVYEHTTDQNIIENASKESIEMIPDESREESGSHNPKDGLEAVETILEDSVEIQDMSEQNESSEHLEQITTLSTESSDIDDTSEEREEISDKTFDSDGESSIKQRVKHLLESKKTRVLEEQTQRTNKIEAKQKVNSNEKDTTDSKTNIESESRISKQEPVEQNLDQSSKSGSGDNEHVQMTKHHPKYSPHKENKLATTDNTIKRIKNGHQHNQHKPPTKVISNSENDSNEYVSDSSKSVDKKVSNTHKSNVHTQEVDTDKHKVKEVQEPVHPKRQKTKSTKIEKQESKEDIAIGDSKPKSSEINSSDRETSKPTEVDQKKVVNVHIHQHPTHNERSKANGESKSTSEQNNTHAQKAQNQRQKENTLKNVHVHKPKNPLHVLSSLKTKHAPEPNSKPSVKSEDEKNQGIQPKTHNEIINGKEFKPPTEQHLPLPETKKDTINPTPEKQQQQQQQQQQTNPEKPKGDVSSVIEEMSNRSDSAVIAVTLTLIATTIVLTIVGVFYRKISIGRRRYVGHTLLETDDELSLFSRDEYHDTGVGYDSWNDDRH